MGPEIEKVDSDMKLFNIYSALNPALIWMIGNWLSIAKPTIFMEEYGSTDESSRLIFNLLSNLKYLSPSKKHNK